MIWYFTKIAKNHRPSSTVCRSAFASQHARPEKCTGRRPRCCSCVRVFVRLKFFIFLHRAFLPSSTLPFISFIKYSIFPCRMQILKIRVRILSSPSNSFSHITHANHSPIFQTEEKKKKKKKKKKIKIKIKTHEDHFSYAQLRRGFLPRPITSEKFLSHSLC